VEGTRHIAAGNLQYQVEIRSADEIGELAKSFNNMAGSLYEARKKLREYFYGIVQSLVRTIEAKDPYTRGHSERVAGYAEKIAVGMGFSAEKAELLKEAAVLHDIGKLGIHEDILNKKEKLTEEEWEAIRMHPATGEDILKPVLGEEMLEAIREHHERCDGTGYPNKLDAGHISIFAKIIAVADTYDAMTSSRAYRAALSKKEAIEELKKGKGSQFDPQVVDVFVKVLEEES
jgi:HD-GYP domain-containing protein (c-di-GMP phosphodiesterase class II)